MKSRTTLDEWYVRQQAKLIIEKTTVLEARARLIEALDITDLQKANEQIGHLKSVLGDAWDKLPSIRQGLMTARETLAASSKEIGNKFNSWDEFVRNIRSKVAAKLTSSLTDTFTIVTALTAGFKTFPAVLESITIETEDGKKSLMDTLRETPDLDTESIMNTPLNQLEVGDDKVDISIAKNLFVKAIRPEGLLAMVKSVLGGGVIPFVDEGQVAEELVSLSPNELSGIAKRAEQLEAPIEQADLQTVAKAEEETNKTSKPSVEDVEAQIQRMSDEGKRAIIAALRKYPPA